MMKTISVIIGNPPYNANQQNENDNNRNREYPEIDRRIRETYVEASTAQKTKQYDMYKRFIRWASDRLADDGIIAFVSNRAFLDAKQDDGFRKIIAQEFNELWVIDMKGNARTSGERRRRREARLRRQDPASASLSTSWCAGKIQTDSTFSTTLLRTTPVPTTGCPYQEYSSHDLDFQEINPDPNANWAQSDQQ